MTTLQTDDGPRKPRSRPAAWSAARLRIVTLCLLGPLALAGCRGGPDGGGRGPAVGTKEGEHHPMVGQGAPDFVGEVPAGGWLALATLRDKPVAIVLYRPGAPFTRELVEAFGRFRADTSMAPTLFVGIARDSMENIRRFVESTDNALPTLRDPGSISESYGVGEAATVVLLDTKRIVRFRMDGFAGPDFTRRVEALAEALRRLPTLAELKPTVLRLDYTRDPRAPVFSATDIEGRPVDLAAFRGQVVVIHFFDQDCPHCIKDLPLLVPVLKEFRPRGVRAIGVAGRDAGGGMRRFLREHGIDYPVIIDTDRTIFTRFDSKRTPDMFIIDGNGFIRFRERGDRADRVELTRLQLRLALGKETPEAIAAALPKGRFAGDGVCASCHAREYADWLMTPHSIAWDSLAQGDKWRARECVPCHVTGQNQPGGFQSPGATLHMTNVQCEVCHGMGGGHPEGKPLDPVALSTTCTACHTGKFVLNFALDEALPLVSHRDQPDLDRLFQYSDVQRQRIEQINTRRLEKFKSGVAHVGSDACRDCHRKEHDQWSATPHSVAFARLLAAKRGADPSCVPCHTTGFGQRRGFGDAMATAGLIGVQCEVCHGPGEDHINAPPALKKETIYGITDQCSFCIIQGVCVTCHDQRNDPDFNIEVALPKVSH